MLNNTHILEQKQYTAQTHAQNAPTEQRWQQCTRDYNIGAHLLRNMGWGADSDFAPLPLGTPPSTTHDGWSQPGIGHPERRLSQHRNGGNINTTQSDMQDTTQDTPGGSVDVTRSTICSILGIPLDAVCSVVELHTDTDKTKNTTQTPPQPPNPPAEIAPGTHERDAAIYALFNEATRASIIRLQQKISNKQGKGERNQSTTHVVNINATTDTQTSPEDFKKARIQAHGGYPNKELLAKAHDDTHPCFTTTWRRVVRATGLPPGAEEAKLKDECRRFCDTCPVCQKLKPARERVLAKTGTIRSRPFSQLAFDIIVLLGSEDAEGHKYILTVTDSFSHSVELFPIKKASAETVAAALHDVLCRYGRPHEVRHDNAKQFTAGVVARLLRLAKIKQHTTAPYSHWSNGQVERANRRVMEVLRVMILDGRLGPLSELKWSLLCPAVRRVINNRMVWRYGCTPNDLVYAQPDHEDSIFDEETWMPRDQQEPAPNGDKTIDELRRQHQVLIDSCEAILDAQVAKVAAKNKYIEHEIEELLPGDTVLADARERPHKKVGAPWWGPYIVVESRFDNDSRAPMVTLQHMATKKIERFHASMLKRCDLDQFDDVAEAETLAAKDVWEYEMEAVLDHEPKGPRRAKVGGRWVQRPREQYSFKVLWKDYPLDESNPSWEPWDNQSLRDTHIYEEYCKRPDVREQLGDDFLAGAGNESDTATQPPPKRKR